MKYNLLFSLLISILFLSDFDQLAAQELQLIPTPSDVKLDPENDNTLSLAVKTWQVDVPADKPLWRKHIRAFAEPLKRLSGIEIERDRIGKNKTATILAVKNNDKLPIEGYEISVAPEGFTISASDIKGLSHATATLLQLIGSARDERLQSWEKISDSPDSSYRSFMVDIGRNAHSLECLKETIDLLWFYKVDSLHLHLTDDQRIAFPSKAFPKLLTENGKITWDEFAQLESYAHARGVTIIPELEVPGHSTLLRRHYPEVFGETPTELAQSQKSRDAIKVLLSELIELFPSSPYIHIGGDEAYGVPVDLQRNLINELHAYLKSKGKKTVVWEGPKLGEGDNKVNEEVIHLNWRTIEFPADKMLEAGYPVVNAAWDPLYLVDHYPRNNFTMVTPQYMYEELELNRFKHFNPGIPTFEKPIFVEPNQRLIGYCMPWWEGREENYFPMVVPRLIPMADVAWRPSDQRDYPSFEKRSEATEATRMKCFYPVSIEASPLVLENDSVFHGRTAVQMKSTIEGDIRFTQDGSQPTASSALFENPFDLDRSAIIRAAVFIDGGQVGHGSRRTMVHVEPIENLALGKPVTSTATSDSPFSVARLTDGGTGNLDYYLGYPAEPNPIKITVDLGELVSINRITVHGFFNNSAYESYEVAISSDGKEYIKVASRLEKPGTLTSSVDHDFEEQEARFVQVVTRGCKSNVFDSFSRLTEIQVFKVD